MSGTQAPVPPTLERQLARKTLVETLRVKRGENVTIETWPHTLSYATAFVYEARRIGAHPLLLLEDEPTYWKSVEDLPAPALGNVGAHEWALLSKTNAYVFFQGPSDRPRYRALPAKKLEALTAYNLEWYRRAKKARIRAARMFLSMASDSQARNFGVDAAAWRKELVEASLVDTRTMVREGRRIAAAFQQGREVTIDHTNGTHLVLRLKGRSPAVDDGVVGPEDVAAGRNMTPIPSGVVAVAVDETFAEGVVRANRPSYLRGKAVEGGTWNFKKGRLVGFQYDSGGEEFSEPYGKAPSGRDRPATLSVGLNPRLHHAPQMEDQERGTLCVAVGGNHWQGGSNRCPFLSWLAIGECDVRVDGKPLVVKGEIR